MPVAAANGPDWGPWGHMMWGSWGIGMMLTMVLFWAALIVALVLLVRWLLSAGTPGRHGGRHAESALEILQRRYARGEISRQEYEDMRRVLREEE
ncbi:MAG: hypothetical protein KatS3mg131_1395 [Candidatus Tectimicrobiota bacterium]|nr:MAG: hypothetical protein KatS3mg131_1395 [Candidatus Tectomicrobia bacterium]